MLRNRLLKNNNGFTLVELLIAMLLSFLVMGAVFISYRSQQRNQTAQESVAQMQQNLRATLMILARDIREAGCDPTRKAGACITEATAGRFGFTRDIVNSITGSNAADGKVDGENENVVYGFADSMDANANGIAEGGGANDWDNPAAIGRNTGGGFQAVAENIQAVEFNYIIQGTASATRTTTTSPSNSQLNEIVGVQVSILARADRTDPDFTGIQNFTTAAGTAWGPFNDNFRRRLGTISIKIRNSLD